MKLGQKIGVCHRRNRDGLQVARRKREARSLGYPWNAIAAALNDLQTVRVIREYLADVKRQAA